jgi:regulator of Ty1 transposition protein 103
MSIRKLIRSPTEIDKSRSTGKKQQLGGSLFKDSSGSTPSELQPLVPLQVALTKAAMTSSTSATTANMEYEKLNDGKTPQPTPPVYAARLSQLLKSLANAESSVSEVIKSRRALIDGLEKILATNRLELSREETLAAELSEKKTQTDTKKRDVEDAIMRGMSTDETSGAKQGDHNMQDEDVGRPEVEALTPPPVEAITPVGSPKPDQSHGAPFTEEPHAPALDLSGISGAALPDLSNISPGGGNDFDLSHANGTGAKRRKTTHSEEDYAPFAGGDLDADVAELLAQEGRQ